MALQEKILNDLATRIRIAFFSVSDEQGQDLIEYALLIALIAFACTAGMGTLATSINSMFKSAAGKLTIA
jgi:pilus assembly protein Flp/PilA